MATCVVIGCERDSKTMEMCSMHRLRVKKHGDPYVNDRERRSVIRRSLAEFPPPTPLSTPCRLWQGPVDQDGYGHRSGGARMHRWAWEQANGPIPHGQLVMHRCDHPPCYRLDHLRLGTHLDNATDRRVKGRAFRPHGELAPARRLTAAEVGAILSKGPTGRRVTELAEQYGVNQTAIRDVVAGRTWSVHPLSPTHRPFDGPAAELSEVLA